ncbi:porin OmpA [Gilliamella sp. B3464]|uniref:porin OmpA n=1 Tax=unclassified Gilliamella TaxID=2685620 RepID=UPI00226A36F2|nr:MULTISPECIES: porin OmpA [unclassified Gilliamella]MCX8712530.1 porin OmpA [Gilliamella sp. B3468]MCX8728194.1 porin OmpA [Gilliamella sp. B2838]MCX8739255.1 porin OmpA [Gilliamella sp. B2824]MCX8751533.1 porin OmpA [Gilliamella sp. B3464]
MKKTTLALAIAVASLTATAANAAYEDNTFYTGAKLGWGELYSLDAHKVRGDDEIGIKTSDRSNVAGGAFVGFQANPYLAFELGYDWLGSAKYKRTWSDDNTKAGNSKVSAQGVSLTGKLSYPLSFISDDLDVYGRAGGMVTIAKWKNSGDYKDYYGHGGTKTDVSPVYALGLDYRLDEDFSTRLEYQYTQHIHTKSDASPDSGLLTLGITYRLGSPAVAAPEVEVKTQENRYVLNEDVLFAYAKADLKPEGRQALDNLLTSLVKINPTQSAIVVIGHTDRIGSDSYNQKLSEQRAHSVMKYLVEKGVPADLISARGMGKSQPVTGTKCNALRGADLKACLAPDRRVEIEVKARNVKEVKVIDSTN